ncbi:MAG TPA: HNH endonuclease, partial [Nocardioides sp.]|nr:HNH endonuclease [Nocardioides sp.]
RSVDFDHPDPYKPNGPPGQTGDHNAAPLGRRHHRAKTHLGYRVRQLGPGTYLWRTPHGLLRLVDRDGTHVLHTD